MLRALVERRIGRRDQANAWIWRLAEYTRDVHEEYAVQRWPETKRLLGLLVNSAGGAHARNARRLIHAARKQDRRLAAALLAAALAHTPEAEEALRGARTRMARKPPALARELLRNFPKRRARNTRRRSGARARKARRDRRRQRREAPQRRRRAATPRRATGDASRQQRAPSAAPLQRRRARRRVDADTPAQAPRLSGSGALRGAPRRRSSACCPPPVERDDQAPVAVDSLRRAPLPSLQATSRPRSASRSRQAASVASAGSARRSSSARSSRLEQRLDRPRRGRASPPTAARLAAPRAARRRAAPPAAPRGAPRR